MEEIGGSDRSKCAFYEELSEIFSENRATGTYATTASKTSVAMGSVSSQQSAVSTSTSTPIASADKQSVGKRKTRDEDLSSLVREALISIKGTKAEEAYEDILDIVDSLNLNWNFPAPTIFKFKKAALVWPAKKEILFLNLSN